MCLLFLPMKTAGPGLLAGQLIAAAASAVVVVAVAAAAVLLATHSTCSIAHTMY